MVTMIAFVVMVLVVALMHFVLMHPIVLVVILVSFDPSLVVFVCQPEQIVVLDRQDQRKLVLLQIVLVVFVGLFVAQDRLTFLVDLPSPVAPTKLVALLQLGLVDSTDHNQPMFVQDPFVLMLFALIYWLSHRPVAARLVVVYQILPWLIFVLVESLGF